MITTHPRSNCKYPKGHKQKSANEQIDILRRYFVGIGPVDEDLLGRIEEDQIKLPQYIDGWFAIPNRIGDQYFGETYKEAEQLAMATFGETRKIYDFRKVRSDSRRLCPTRRTDGYLKKLSEEQGEPGILLVPAQFGIFHQGETFRHAQDKLRPNEFCLGVFDIITILLTHPERLQGYLDLQIDCGDMIISSSGNIQDEVSYFKFDGGQIEFGVHPIDEANILRGIVTGFDL